MPFQKTILVLTTSSLATNPRLVKELQLMRHRYAVHCCYFRIGGWSNPIDKALERDLSPVTFYRLSATRQPFGPWLLAATSEKIARILGPLLKRHRGISAYASSRRSAQLWWRVRQLNLSPHLVIAHNLGALYPAWRLARKYGIPFGFDVEDYHPGEAITGSKAEVERERERRTYLMQTLLPTAAYLTHAAPLIGGEVTKLVGNRPQSIVIHNAFPASEFIISPEIDDRRLRLVWFSQNVDFGRGLERMLDVAKLYQDQIGITLIGNVRPRFAKQYITPNAHFVNIINPLPQAELHQTLAKHDIGLALEDGTVDINRNLCLTNKIFAYAQAGLFILATDTPAQRQFLDQHPCLGQITAVNQDTLPDVFVNLILQKDKIRSVRYDRFRYAQSLSFEHEERKLLTLWSDILSVKKPTSEAGS